MPDEISKVFKKSHKAVMGNKMQATFATLTIVVLGFIADFAGDAKEAFAKSRDIHVELKVINQKMEELNSSLQRFLTVEDYKAVNNASKIKHLNDDEIEEIILRNRFKDMINLK